jgi:MFS family permease
MKGKRKAISPLLYYTLISSLTNLILIVVGIVAFALSSLRTNDKTVIIIIAIVLLWKGGIVGLATWLFHKKFHNKEFAVKFIGFYLGRFFGILIGGFLGVRITNLMGVASILGFIVGALALYFVGRWIGPIVSITIGSQLDTMFSLTETHELEKSVEAKPPKKFFLVLYGVVLPLLFLVIGLLINCLDIPVSHLVELLPISRIIAIVFSILSIGFPWLIRKRWLIKFQSNTFSPESVTPWLGLAFSVVPSVYGFALFIGMGASTIELCFFTMTSSIAAIIWSVSDPTLKEQIIG